MPTSVVRSLTDKLMRVLIAYALLYAASRSRRRTFPHPKIMLGDLHFYSMSALITLCLPALVTESLPDPGWQGDCRNWE